MPQGRQGLTGGPAGMISITNLDFHFGSRSIYEGANLHIKPRDRMGLIGPNGAGKSTLLRLITGEYQPDGGTISKSNDCTIGFLNQDLLSYQTDDSILQVAMQAFERALVVEKEIERTLHLMETAYEDKLVDRLTRLQEEYDVLDGYSIQSKAEEILEGLGFTTDDLQQPLRNFSGGWRMRVMLAKLLLQQPSLLMLDEPTNHLDLPSIQWIENYLQSYEGAIIVVSHDREFINNTVNVVVEVRGGKFELYAGNYEFYLEEKALRRTIQKSAFENQQAQIRQTERFIDRFRAKASKSRQVQSRVKMLERMDMLDDVVDENARVNFRFNFNQASGRQVVQLEQVSKAYGPKVILTNTDAIIERGDKIALIGANGKGKSTLLRIISGTEPIEGKRTMGHNVIPAFFAQHQLESLNVDNNLLDELKQAGTQKTEMELRSVLGCFLFSNDDVFKKIKVLSGGEKSRVALARTLISEANFLLLDEPTNHLDIVSVNILIQALQQYEGTFITVSHDRFFVSQIANKIWYIEGQEIKEYPGTYEEYEFWMEQRRANGDKGSDKGNDKPDKSAPKPKAEPAAKAAAQPLNGESLSNLQKQQKALAKQVTQLEADIEAAEKQKDTLTELMSRPEIFGNHEKLAAEGQRLARVEDQLLTLMAQWDQATEQAKQLQQQISALQS